MTLGIGYLPIKQQGNGVTNEFSFDFLLVTPDSLVVEKTNALGVTTTLILNSDYTYTTNISGGIVTLVQIPTAYEYITISRNTPKSQGSEYSTSKSFDAKAIEFSFDKPTAMIQELADGVRRSLKSSIGTITEYHLPTPNAGHGLIWNDLGTDLKNSDYNISSLETIVKQAEDFADASEASSIESANSATASASSATASANSATESSNYAIASAASADEAEAFAQSINPNKFNWQNNGVVTLPTYNDHGDGSITINADGLYNFFKSANALDGLMQDTVDSAATFTLTDRAITYIYANYNSGTPIYGVTTNPLDLFVDGSKVAIYRISRYGTVLRIINYDEFGVALANKMYFKDVYLNGYQRSSGLILSTAATRISTITAGVIWFGVTKNNTSDNIAGSSGNLYEIYPTASVYDRYTVTQYDSSYYSDGVNRLTLGTNKWVCKYFYISAATGNNAFYMHGSQYNNSAAALAEAVPAAPTILSSHCIYVGKILVQQGSTNGVAYPRDWSSTTTSTTVPNHDDLSNINLAASGITYGHINDQAQTIVGVKTFTSSPIVPTPTTDMQAATKLYVDSLSSGLVSKNPGDILYNGSTNFKIANNTTDATNDIDISIGYTLSTSGNYSIILTSAMTKRLDANWVAGTNQGGLATGLTKTNSTWYHCFAIYNPTTKTTDIGFDTSITATNLLAGASGYTEYKRIGSIYVLPTGVIRPVMQIGKEFFYQTRVLDINVTSLPSSYSDITLSVPTGIIVEASIETYFIGAAAAGAVWEVYIQGKGSNSERVVNILSSTSGTNQASINNNIFKTNTSAQIAYKSLVLSGTPSSNSFTLITNGYKDIIL